MDRSQISGSAQDFAAKLEGTVGNLVGEGKARAEYQAREAAGAAQNLYGHASDQERWASYDLANV